MSKVKTMENSCSGFIQRWLGVPPFFNSFTLYSKTSMLSLQISSVAEEYKAPKAGAVSTLLLSEDQNVRNKRKWRTYKEVE